MKVGDYVRTNDGYINKIISLSEWNVVVEAKKLIGEKLIIAKTEIINSNSRIIDLIQVGDYVNGLPVMKIEINEDGERNIYVGEENTTFGWLVYYDIKSIVTKEMFEQMEYRTGE